MSEIIISKKINLTEDPNNISPLYVNKLFMGNEPDNELVQYYIVPTASMQEDKQSKVVLSDYDKLSWGNKRRRLTARKISNLGIKTFPTYGAIGFFTYKYGERSMILCPVNNNHTKFIAPTISMKNTGTQLEFTITCPDTITYYCYRIIIRQGDFAIEYITYDLKLTVPIPDVKGNYEIFCIGYINEGEAISFNSNVISFKVYTGKETFEPDPTISYYTKTEIDELIKSIVKTYTGDNETIDVNQDTGVITVNADYRKIIESGGGGSTYIADVSTKEITTIDNITTGEVIAVNTIEILED